MVGCATEKWRKSSRLDTSLSWTCCLPPLGFQLKSELDSDIFFPFLYLCEYFLTLAVASRGLVHFCFNLAVVFILPNHTGNSQTPDFHEHMHYETTFILFGTPTFSRKSNSLSISNSNLFQSLVILILH